MDHFQSIFLGIVQGVTEFLPISSSGHLVILPWLFNWKEHSLSFDVALHIGTLCSMISFFWKDWLKIILEWKKPLLWMIILGCIPAGIAGVIFEDYFESLFRSPLIVACMMFFVAIVIIVAERLGKKDRGIKDIGFRDAIIIGFSQVLALIPGVSRSGITITAGLFLGLDRPSSARFSFLLAMPIILGAGLLKLKHIYILSFYNNEIYSILFGFLFSAISGFVAIGFLLKYVEKHNYFLFVWYRIILSVAVFIIYFIRSN